jgi:hypothetical protein
MSNEGMMRPGRCLYLAAMLAMAPAAFAQTPPARAPDDLDVTMRVIVDPNAKVPDEIVRRIQLPKPATPAPPLDKPAPGPPPAAGAHEQGRDFGEQVSEEAKQRSEEARRNHKPPPGTPGTPGPPHKPPGPPPKPPRGG